MPITHLSRGASSHAVLYMQFPIVLRPRRCHYVWVIPLYQGSSVEKTLIVVAVGHHFFFSVLSTCGNIMQFVLPLIVNQGIRDA